VHGDRLAGINSGYIGTSAQRTLRQHEVGRFRPRPADQDRYLAGGIECEMSGGALLPAGKTDVSHSISESGLFEPDRCAQTVTRPCSVEFQLRHINARRILVRKAGLSHESLVFSSLTDSSLAWRTKFEARTRVWPRRWGDGRLLRFCAVPCRWQAHGLIATRTEVTAPGYLALHCRLLRRSRAGPVERKR
jgi:hypothetical protein